MSKTFVSGAAARRLHTRDKKNIFKHYGKQSHEQLLESKDRLTKHIAHYKPQGIHTTPEHMQSINYHLKNKALESRKK